MMLVKTEFLIYAVLRNKQFPVTTREDLGQKGSHIKQCVPFKSQLMFNCLFTEASFVLLNKALTMLSRTFSKLHIAILQ